MEAPSLSSTTLELPPSCIAFCPTQPEYFVVGTYFLEPTAPASQNTATEDEELSEAKRPQERRGSLVLYQLKRETPTPSNLQTLPLLGSAVLDITWSPHAATTPLLAVATSTGSIQFFILALQSTGHGPQAKLHHLSTHQIADPETLVLDLVYHPLIPTVLGATLSTGEVLLCRSTSWQEPSHLTLTTLTTHGLEPWTLAFSTDGNRVFTGGDDAVLQSVDIERCLSNASCGVVETSEPQVLWKDRRMHGAGVTAVLTLPLPGSEGEVLVTGSYDDCIRVLLGRGSRRTVAAEKNLEGGVWRIEMIEVGQERGEESGDCTTYTLLASCMHAGARVLRLVCTATTSDWTFSEVARFTEHKSMNYGSAVQPGHARPKSGKTTGVRVVSTSFYDKLMYVWEVDV